MAFALLSRQTNIDFVGFRRIAFSISGFFIIIGLIAIIMNGGLRYGVDFAGGVMVQVEFAQPIPDEQVKTALQNVDLPGLTVQQVDTENRDYLLRFSMPSGENQDLREQVSSALKSSIPDNASTIQRLESVGPKVGNDLRNMAIEALFYAVLLITVYISGRFEYSWFMAGAMALVLWGAVYGASYLGFNRLWGVAIGMIITLICCWKLKLNFALGAILALIHDVIVTLGLLTLLGVEIDLNVIAALLTLVGYSINDTIVVYDRIRESARRARRRAEEADHGRDHQQVREPDALAHHHDLRHHSGGQPGPVSARRQRHPQLCAHHHPRHRLRYLLLHLRGFSHTHRLRRREPLPRQDAEEGRLRASRRTRHRVVFLFRNHQDLRFPPWKAEVLFYPQHAEIRIFVFS